MSVARFAIQSNKHDQVFQGLGPDNSRGMVTVRGSSSLDMSLAKGISADLLQPYAMFDRGTPNSRTFAKATELYKTSE